MLNVGRGTLLVGRCWLGAIFKNAQLTTYNYQLFFAAFLRGTRCEFEADLALFEVEGEVGFERTLGALRDEAVEQWSLTFGE